MNPEAIKDAGVSFLLVLGTAIAALGAIGVIRMPDPYMRAQAAAKPGTLGLFLIFAAVALHQFDIASVARALGIILFAFLSIPVGAHMITRATHEAGVPIGPPEATDELRDAASEGEHTTADSD